MPVKLPNVPTALAHELNNHAAKGFAIAAGWMAVVLLFAGQWFAYDAAHGVSDPFLFYLGWSCYLWGILTPLAAWISWRRPIQSGTWQHAVPLHLLVSVLLTSVQLSAEASIAWFRLGEPGSLTAMLAHYFRQHLQIGLLTYWFLVGVTHFYRLHDQARKRQVRAAQLEACLAEAQIENLRTRLHPHFLFNTLQAAATLIHEDPGGAEDIVLRLSELLRVSLNEMRTQEIPLAREIDFVEHYMSIQRRRFGDRLRFELQIDPGTLACAVPTLVLQPLVENAVRHGVDKHKESDIVTIRAFREQDRLCLEVSNYTSSLEGAPEKHLSVGIGLSNTRERLEQLYGEEQSLRLFRLDPKGVCVQVSIPSRQLPADETALARAVTA